jgi:hypothetical protein
MGLQQGGSGFSNVNLVNMVADTDLAPDEIINNTNILYDSDENGIVDNSELVNGHSVDLDINNTPITLINAQDDWDSI